MGVEENGSGDLGLSIGSKNKYRRMDSEMTDEDLEVVQYKQTQQDRSSSTSKYVFACVVFASLNNVLLGYDEPPTTSCEHGIQKNPCMVRNA
ncbi:hypothetical protein E3N88_31264 [Mikania micrantha]|uniref:Uncharacterized protein n=1 Tax=Mikania micrantha TaxID=192012 RepID=A0A5N6MP51_9ASTR|nr:hypothetical protein E3N88_31264 [Mikania micrantha]